MDGAANAAADGACAAAAHPDSADSTHEVGRSGVQLSDRLHEGNATRFAADTGEAAGGEDTRTPPCQHEEWAAQHTLSNSAPNSQTDAAPNRGSNHRQADSKTNACAIALPDHHPHSCADSPDASADSGPDAGPEMENRDGATANTTPDASPPYPKTHAGATTQPCSCDGQQPTAAESGGGGG